MQVKKGFMINNFVKLKTVKKMKKSKFANINFESVEVLSREQMSKVKGGYDSCGWTAHECEMPIYSAGCFGGPSAGACYTTGWTKTCCANW